MLYFKEASARQSSALITAGKGTTSEDDLKALAVYLAGL